MFSWSGAFFVIRGSVILYSNSQIAEIKQFLSAKGFHNDPITGQDIIDILFPVYMAVAMILTFLVFQYTKNRMVIRNFKIEQHPYYQIQ